MADVGDPRCRGHRASSEAASGPPRIVRRTDDSEASIEAGYGSARARAHAEDEVIEIEPGELSGIFSAPQWLRDLGFTAWLLFGVAAALVGAIWLLSLTETIVMPVITAGIIAAVAAPAGRPSRGTGSRGDRRRARLPRDRR